MDFPLIFDYLLTAQELESEAQEDISEEHREVMLEDATAYVKEYYQQGLIKEKDYIEFMEERRRV